MPRGPPGPCRSGLRRVRQNQSQSQNKSQSQSPEEKMKPVVGVLALQGDVPEHLRALEAAGAAAIFPPGTVIANAAEELLRKLNSRLGHERAAAE